MESQGPLSSWRRSFANKNDQQVSSTRSTAVDRQPHGSSTSRQSALQNRGALCKSGKASGILPLQSLVLSQIRTGRVHQRCAIFWQPIRPLELKGDECSSANGINSVV